MKKNLMWLSLLASVCVLSAWGLTKMTSVQMVSSTIDSTPIGQTAPAAGTFTSLNGALNAATYSGSDIGAKINAAFAALPNGGTVTVPTGTWSFTTQAVIPVASNLRYALICDPGAVLNWIGSGVGILASGTPSMQNLSVTIQNCTVDGTGSTSGSVGIEMQGFYGSQLQNDTARNFSGGVGILFHGAGISLVTAPHLYANKYGMQLLGDSTTATASNAIHVIGGSIGGNSTWGIYDDYSDNTATGATINNSYEGIDFAVNGTASTTSGNIFLEAPLSFAITNNYFESVVGTENVQAGTNGQAAGMGVITGNHIDNTSSSVNMFDLINLNTGLVTGNHYQTSTCLANAGIFSGNIAVYGNFGSGSPTCGTAGAFGLTYSTPLIAALFKSIGGQAVTLEPGSGASYSLLVTDPTNSFNALAVDASGNATIHGTLTSGGDKYFSTGGCSPATGTDSACTGTITLSPAYGDAAYIPQLTINANNGAYLAISISGALTSSSIPYTITCTFNCGSIAAPTIYVHTHHN